MIPVARRVLGKGNIDVVRLRWSYGCFLYHAPTPRSTTSARPWRRSRSTYRTVRRVFGAEHSYTREMDPHDLRLAQAELRGPRGQVAGDQ